MKKYQTILLLLLACISCHAQHRHHRHHHHHHSTMVVHHTAKLVVSNKLSSRDRLNMAIAYLKTNKSMSAGTYSKMTGLTRATAEAELNAFAADRKTPIGIATSGKKNVYVLIA